MSITGAFTATVTANLCAVGGASIAVHVQGDSQTYLGAISATAFGFIGPSAAAYTLVDGQAKPAASADKMSFTVKGAVLKDFVSGKTITATGTVTCP